MKLFSTYDELLSENLHLKSENEQLKQSNAILLSETKQLKKVNQDLKNQLAVAGIILNESDFRYANKETEMSVPEKIALFRSLFRGREDVFAKRWFSKRTGKSGYQPVCINEWDTSLCDKRKYKCSECPNRKFKELSYEDIKAHLKGSSEDGRDVIGIYVLLPDNNCNLLCVDFDDKTSGNKYQKEVSAFVQVCKDWSIPYAIERSRSGQGAHVWIFFSEPLPAKKARRLGYIILTEAMTRNGAISFKTYDRFFPNQDTMPEGGFGNLVALPLQGKAVKNDNSIFVDDNFNKYPSQLNFMQSIRRISESDIDAFLMLHNTPSELGELSESTESEPWKTPASEQLTSNDFPGQLTIIRANSLYIKISGLSAKAINPLKRIASFKNPDFYAKQAMRLPTYNIPRVISCAEVTDDYVILPRGCEDAVINLLKTYHLNPVIENKTNKGTPIAVSFNGDLRQEQNNAVETLMQCNNGVLNGTTAFGKTVTGINLIARRKVNTLILVHTKALLDQWISRLEQFLSVDLPDNPIANSATDITANKPKRGRMRKQLKFGTLYSSKNMLNGSIDVALMQSCFDKDNVKPFIRDYGMIIVDECHHLPAVSFERILRFTDASYVYGLTATPIRKDGHQPIIFMQCGPIRYSADANSQMTRQSFRRLLIPRITSFRAETDIQYATLIKRMSENQLRNELIVTDVIKALDNGRTPIVLTNLTSHVQALANLLKEKCKNVIALTGSESVKLKREKIEQLNLITDTDQLIIVATGKYIGEGFDFPRLDTLFLALPISWKGIVAQYAGRLHREYLGKTDVRIYDYADIHIPICDKMYNKRLKGYAAIGYSVYADDKNDGPEYNIIYNGLNYFKDLLEDLESASGTVLVSVPDLWMPMRSSLWRLLSEIISKGIKIQLVTRKSNQVSDRLANIGISVICKEKLSIHAAIIDAKLVWYGNINYFGQTKEEQTTIRIQDYGIAQEISDAILRGCLC